MGGVVIVVYYESLKRELKTKPIKECRCDERLQTRVECALDVIGAPSILRLTRKAAALARVLPTLLLSCARNAARRKTKSPPLVDCAGCTPEAAKKRSVSR